MGWAGRRESREDVIVFGQRRQRVTTKCRLSLAPVEEHMRDVWVLGEQGLVQILRDIQSKLCSLIRARPQALARGHPRRHRRHGAAGLSPVRG
jgi:hypothetical protein